MLCLCLLNTVRAQNLFGVKAGVTLAEQTNTVVEPNLRFDVTLGLSYEWQTKLKNLWIQPEFNYIKKGVRLDVVRNTTQFKRVIQYLEVPVLVKYKYIYSNQFDWALAAGPSVGYALSAENRFFRIGQPTVETLNIEKGNGVNPIDIGFIIGAEANFAVDYGQICIYGRLQYGISRVASDENGLPVRNRLFETGMFFKFGRARNMVFDQEVLDKDAKRESKAAKKEAGRKSSSKRKRKSRNL